MRRNPRLDALLAEVAEANAALQPPPLVERIAALLQHQPLSLDDLATLLGVFEDEVRAAIASRPFGFVALDGKYGVAVAPTHARARPDPGIASDAAKERRE